VPFVAGERQTNVKLIDMPGLLVPGSMAERLTLEDLKAERQFLKKPPCKRCRKMIRNLCAPKMLKKECSTFFLHLFFWGMVPAWSFSDRKSSHKRKAGEPRMIESGRAQKGSTESIGRSEITIRFSGQVVFL